MWRWKKWWGQAECVILDLTLTNENTAAADHNSNYRDGRLFQSPNQGSVTVVRRAQGEASAKSDWFCLAYSRNWWTQVPMWTAESPSSLHGWQSCYRANATSIHPKDRFCPAWYPSSSVAMTLFSICEVWYLPILLDCTFSSAPAQDDKVGAIS